MKTLHLTNCWHAESGGIGTFYRELMDAAEREGRQIRLVVPGPRESVEERGQFARIYQIQGRAVNFSPGYRLILPQSYLLPGGALRRILDEECPDLVECCDRYTLNYLAALLRRGWLMGRDYRPAVIGLQCERMDDNMATYVSQRELAKRFCQWYLRWLQFPMFDHHIVVSRYVASELREVAAGHDVRRGVWVRPHGVATSVFRPDLRSVEARATLAALSGAPEGSTLLLYAGRLAPEKNLGLLVDTMAALEKADPGRYHLLIVGDGPSRRDLECEFERKLPGAYYFLGHVRDRARLASLYANADVFVHPNAQEPFGIAPLEAMASGLAVVVPNTGGVRTYADADNAWTADPTARGFSQAIQRIHTDPDERTRRQRNARSTAERFDWAHITRGYFELYEQLHALVKDQRQPMAIAPEFVSTAARRDAVAARV